MKIIEVAVAVIIDNDDRVLLTQRFDLDSPDIHLRWQLPGGGIEKNEDPFDACLREVREETGLEVEILSNKPFKVLQKYPNALFNLNVYLATPISGTINTDLDDETNDAKWYQFDQIDKLSLLDNTLEMVKHCMEIWKKR